MGKTLTASQMLSAGRKRPPTPAETGTELATRQLDDQTSKRLGDTATSAVNDQTTKRLDDQMVRPNTSSSADRELERQPQATGKPAATYQRATVFLTPAQRQWLKLTARQLPEGLSASDMVRLAISRLSTDVTDGLDLVSHLTDQAHSDAEVFSGRRNRGLPPRAEIDA